MSAKERSGGALLLHRLHRHLTGPRLSALRDGDLPPIQAALLSRHLRRCRECRDALAELDRQVAGLSALSDDCDAPAGEGGERDQATWHAIQAALHEDPPGAHWPAPAAPRPGTARPGRPAWLWAGLPVGAAVAAVLALTVVGPGRLFSRRPSDDVIISLAEEQFQKAERPYQQALDQLLLAAERARGHWEAPRQRAFAQALTGLSAETRQRLLLARQRPADAAAQERLYAAYRREIAFLQEGLFRGRHTGPLLIQVSQTAFSDSDNPWEDR